MRRFGWPARWFAVILLTSAACGEATPPIGGGNVPSRVVITPGQARLATVGDTMRLRAALYDDYGIAVAGGAVTWTSLDPELFTIDQNGLVTGAVAVSVGRAVATIGAQSDTAYVVVAHPDASPCLGYPLPITLAVGQATALSMTDAMCIAATSDEEYVVVPWHGSSTGGSTVSLDVTGSGLSTVGPSLSVSGAAPLRSAAPARGFAFERSLREAGRQELMPLARSARAEMASRKKSGVRAAMIPSYLSLGDLVELNARMTSACGTPTFRTGRVAAISARAIVVYDTTNPSGGFTDAHYQRFAVAFDTLVAPVADAAFGAPTDLDVNGKVVIFFTRAVNELTPSGADYYYGGFFHPRDLLPQHAYGAPYCPGSNEREMFYMLAPDPDGVINGNVRTAGFVDTITVGTLAHEHQHLVNFARRAYVNEALNDEEVWLNEGLSHIAEELVFYRATGTAPRQNLGASSFGSQPFDAMFAQYMAPNFGRLRVFLENPHTSSPYSSADGLGTRGAVWSFLRYAADRRGSGDGDTWMRLVNSTSYGLFNLADVFGPDILGIMQRWQVSLYADDAVAGIDADFSQPSWNFRTAFPAMPTSPRPYPLGGAVLSLTNDATQSIALRGGSGAFLRFAVAAGREASIRVTSGGFVAPAAVQAMVLRTR
jgi:hypothetical protein